MKDLSILIVGAGIGGLTMALALRRRGLNARIVERASDLTEVGAGIWMPPNAMQVFERLGLDQKIAEIGWPLRAVEVTNNKGDLFHHLSLQAPLERYGQTIVSIHRAELQKLLAEAFGLDNIGFGKECLSIKEGDGGCIIEFNDGSSERADLIVGADGLRSKVRDFVSPGIELRDSGQTCFRGVATMTLPEDEGQICREIWGNKKRFGFSPIGPERVYWFAPIDQPCDIQADDGKAALLDLYADFEPLIHDILEATPATGILRTDLKDIAPLAQWYRGTCVLMGDAAHATSPNLGQGAAQAIESAYVLAKAIATFPSLDVALSHYVSTRQGKAHHVTKTSWTFGKVSQMEDGVMKSFRDVTMKAIPDFINESQVHKLYSLDY